MSQQANEKTSSKEVCVLMLNDFPVGVYSSSDNAKAAIAKHMQLLRDGGVASQLYYHTYNCVIDGEAQ